MSRLGLRIPALVWVVLVSILSVVANAQETTGSMKGCFHMGRHRNVGPQAQTRGSLRQSMRDLLF